MLDPDIDTIAKAAVVARANDDHAPSPSCLAKDLGGPLERPVTRIVVDDNHQRLGERVQVGGQGRNRVNRPSRRRLGS